VCPCWNLSFCEIKDSNVNFPNLYFL
jgi:hypothetical protein